MTRQMTRQQLISGFIIALEESITDDSREGSLRGRRIEKDLSNARKALPDDLSPDYVWRAYRNSQKSPWEFAAGK